MEFPDYQARPDLKDQLDHKENGGILDSVVDQETQDLVAYQVLMVNWDKMVVQATREIKETLVLQVLLGTRKMNHLQDHLALLALEVVRVQVDRLVSLGNLANQDCEDLMECEDLQEDKVK
jgi:hypothetical protein